MIKKQQGVALIVALIVTAIVGIIAISLSSTAFRTQRSQNISTSTASSYSNAVSGINRAINFLRASAVQQELQVFDVKMRDDEPIFIGGVNRRDDLENHFKGVENQIADDFVNVSLNNGSNLWYRVADWFNNPNNDCLSCVSVNTNNRNVVFRIEKRQCRGSNAATSGPSATATCKGGHRMFRITALGTNGTVDDNSPADSVARTIIQTHVGIRDID
jgi:Tfp pilus assembly protein PilX